MKRMTMITAVLALAACGTNPDGGYIAPEDTLSAHHENGHPGAPQGEYYGVDDYYAEPVDGTIDHSGENYEGWVENDFVETGDEPTSTFSIDVDTGSYTLMRRDLRAGTLPHKDGVRLEEYINFFKYSYPAPTDDPFSINLEVAPSEFGDDLHMLRVGLRGKSVTKAEMAPVNLVFLVDVSGSMSGPMSLVRSSLKTLTNNLREGDHIAIVTYASNPGVLLNPTNVSDKQTILSAIDGLNAGGSTNGEGGIMTAYALAEQHRVDDGINRIVLITDGDFNVGVTGGTLEDLVEEKRDLHIGLTVAGVGVGNYNDAMLEAFARRTNGNYIYIDSPEEADRVFGTELTSTLAVIAADVKIQIEFDPAAVVRYRLVGYENRVLNNEDFEDDTKDAGEIGAGHTVTALYEIELDETATPESGFIAEVRLRHKAQFGEDSQLQTRNIKPSQVKASVADATADLRFALAVTEFAEILRESKHTEGLRLDDIESLATGATQNQPDRVEFLELLELARPLLQP